MTHEPLWIDHEFKINPKNYQLRFQVMCEIINEVLDGHRPYSLYIKTLTENLILKLLINSPELAECLALSLDDLNNASL